MRLELAYLYQQLGDFARARREYDLVTKTDSSGIYAPRPFEPREHGRRDGIRGQRPAGV